MNKCWDRTDVVPFFTIVLNLSTARSPLFCTHGLMQGSPVRLLRSSWCVGCHDCCNLSGTLPGNFAEVGPVFFLKKILNLFDIFWDASRSKTLLTRLTPYHCLASPHLKALSATIGLVLPKVMPRKCPSKNKKTHWVYRMQINLDRYTHWAAVGLFVYFGAKLLLEAWTLRHSHEAITCKHVEAGSELVRTY